MKLSLRGAGWDTVFLTGSRLATALTGILTSKILAKRLSLFDNGTYSEYLILVGLIGTLITFGMIDALNLFFNRHAGDSEKQKKCVNTIFSVVIVFGFLAAGAVLLLKGSIVSYFSDEALLPIIFFIAFKPTVDVLLNLFTMLLISSQRAKIVALFRLVSTIIWFLLVSLGVTLDPPVYFITLFAILIDSFYLILFFLLFAKKKFVINPFKPVFSFLRPLFRFALPMALFAITNTVSREIGKIVIGGFENTEMVAIYANCTKVLPFDIISAAFATVMIPYIIRYVDRGRYKECAGVFAAYVNVGRLTVWTLASGAIVVAPTLLRFFYDEKYEAGLAVFVIYLFVDIISFLNLSLVITAKGKTTHLMLYAIGQVALNTGLTVAFYHLFGILGPAIAAFMTTLLFNMALLLESAYILKTSVATLISLKDMGVFALFLAVWGTACHFLYRYLLTLPIHPYLVMLVVLGIYAVFVLLVYSKKLLALFCEINRLKLGENA